MKHLYIISLAFAAILAFAGCQASYTTYSGPSYISFADSLNICPVQQDGGAFKVMIASTRPSLQDRTFGVEVIDSKSNAVFGHHYTIPSQTVTIPAGEMSASIDIIGNYDSIEAEDSLSVTLALVSVEDEDWDLYGQKTRVLLKKVCPFDLHNFEGYCMVTSTFWLMYDTSKLSRVSTAEVVEGKDNALLVKDFLMEGFDIELEFDNSDILNPRVSLVEDQVMGDTRVAFNYIYGDGMIRAMDAPIDSQVFMCNDYFVFYTTLYVKEVGVIGTYVNIVERISDEEAEYYK